eukprot:7365414-Karenia_brevis.AAC.1
MEAVWNALPISELPGQFDYDMIAFVVSVPHDGKYGCVVGRVRANNKITGKINHDVRCYAKYEFCHARMAWVTAHHATSYNTMWRTGQVCDKCPILRKHLTVFDPFVKGWDW